MKKTYIAPVMEELNIETVDMMATSLGTSEEIITSRDALTNERRGQWGNLWE